MQNIVKTEWLDVNNLHFTKNHWRNAIFSGKSTSYILQRKNQVKMPSTDEERFPSGCIQLANTGNGGKLSM
jgi:hypothetical protein